MSRGDSLLSEFGLQQGQLRRWKRNGNVPENRQGRTFLVLAGVDQTRFYQESGYRTDRENVVRVSTLEEDGSSTDASRRFDGWGAGFVRKHSLLVCSSSVGGP